MTTVHHTPDIRRRIAALERDVARLSSTWGRASMYVDATGKVTFPGGVKIGGPDGSKPVQNKIPGGATGLVLSTGADENEVWIEASWTAPTGEGSDQVSGYEVNLTRLDDSGAPIGRPTIAVVDVGTSSHRFAPVVPGATYQVRIRTLNVLGSSRDPEPFWSWSDVATIVAGIDATPPGQVTGLVAGSGYRTLTASWDEVQDADVVNGHGQYHVQVATDPAFPAAAIVRDTKVGGLVTSFTDLAAGTTYHVRVRAIDASGNAGDWSATAATTPGEPELHGDGKVPPTPTVAPSITGGIGFMYATWPEVENEDPTWYDVHVSTATGFAPSATTKVGQVQGTGFFIQQMPDGTALAYDTVYYVRYVPIDPDGAGGASPQGSGSMSRGKVGDIGEAAILASNIAAGAVGASELATAAVQAEKLASGAVTSTKITDGAVTTPALAANAVVAGTIAADAINTNHIQAGAVTAASAILATAAVGTANIQTAAISEAKVGTAAITTAKIHAAAVTNAKIGNLAVDTAQINDLAVSNVKIGSGAVTNLKVNDLNVTKLTGGTLSTSRIYVSSYMDLGTGGRLYAGSGTKYVRIDPNPYVFFYDGGYYSYLEQGASTGAQFSSSVRFGGANQSGIVYCWTVQASNRVRFGPYLYDAADIHHGHNGYLSTSGGSLSGTLTMNWSPIHFNGSRQRIVREDSYHLCLDSYYSSSSYASVRSYYYRVSAKNNGGYTTNRGGTSLRWHYCSGAGSSDENIKRDIRAVDRHERATALGKLRGMPMHRYRLEDEDDTTPPHLGAMAQDMPLDMLVPPAEMDDGNLIECFSYNDYLAYLHAAIQELADTIEAMGGPVAAAITPPRRVRSDAA